MAAKFWSGVITWFPLGFKVQSGLSLEFKHIFAASFTKSEQQLLKGDTGPASFDSTAELKEGREREN